MDLVAWSWIFLVVCLANNRSCNVKLPPFFGQVAK